MRFLRWISEPVEIARFYYLFFWVFILLMGLRGVISIGTAI